MADLSGILRVNNPIINYEAPESEREAVNKMQFSLTMLSGFVEDFHAALKLHGHAMACMAAATKPPSANDAPRLIIPLNVSSKWIAIAMRSGAMTLREFQETMQTIRGGARSAPSLYEKIDTKKLRTAENLFDSYFPQTRGLRNKVGHLARSTFKELEAARTGKSRSLFVHNVATRTYTTIHQGKNFSYSLSEESLIKMHDIRLRIFESFNVVNKTAPKTG